MKIAILGTGSFGIAISKLLENKNIEIFMWTKYEEEKKLLNQTRENPNFLPGVKINKNIIITNDLQEAVNSAFLVINIMPLVAISETIKELEKYIKKEQIICSMTKGMDEINLYTVTEMFRKKFPENILCSLSGPSFAIDIVNKQEIYLVLASKDIDKCENVIELFESKNIKIEKSTDEKGVEVCGAIKNAIAIGSGMLFGMKASDSTKAAYLVRGIKDMVKIVESLGGKIETVYSYAGIGDLMLTCMSEKSRNFSFGKLIGEGKTKEESLNILNAKTIEGIKTVESLNNHMQLNNIKLDTIPKIYDVLYNNVNINVIKI